MKMLVTVLLSAFAVTAKADIISCYFTEPFVGTEYSMAQQTLTITDYTGESKTVLKNVSFQIIEAGKFQLLDADKKVLQTITLTNNGSDGMSETIYPYEVKDESQAKYANSGIGGCESNYLKAKKGQD